MEDIKTIGRFLSSAFENKHYKHLFKDINACYIVDYENVHQQGLSGIQYLPKHSVVCVFYSQITDTIPIETARVAVNGKCKLLFFKVEAGQKNSLDFQLVTFLGYLIAKHQSLNIRIPYYIITKDTGFQNTAKFWLQLGFQIHIQNKIIIPDEAEQAEPKPTNTSATVSKTVISTFSAQEVTEEKSVQKQEKPLPKTKIPSEFTPLSSFLKNKIKDKADQILQYAIDCTDKVEFRNRLVKDYGEKFAITWYKKIRKYLPYKNKKSSNNVLTKSFCGTGNIRV